MRGNRDARRMMDKMGLNVKKVDDVREVVIRTDRKEIVVSSPEVAEMGGGDDAVIYTVTGKDFEERELDAPTFRDEDVELVCMQAGVEKGRATDALAESDGDIAKAILMLSTSG